MVEMEIPLWVFNVLSLVASFALTLFFVWKKPKTLVMLAALAVVLFVLFGPFALPGFFLAVGARAFLVRKPRRK